MGRIIGICLCDILIVFLCLNIVQINSFEVINDSFNSYKPISLEETYSSPAERTARTRAVFTSCDSDKDGTIDLKEFAEKASSLISIGSDEVSNEVDNSRSLTQNEVFDKISAVVNSSIGIQESDFENQIHLASESLRNEHDVCQWFRIGLNLSDEICEKIIEHRITGFDLMLLLESKEEAKILLSEIGITRLLDQKRIINAVATRFLGLIDQPSVPVVNSSSLEITPDPSNPVELYSLYVKVEGIDDDSQKYILCSNEKVERFPIVRVNHSDKFTATLPLRLISPATECFIESSNRAGVSSSEKFNFPLSSSQRLSTVELKNSIVPISQPQPEDISLEDFDSSEHSSNFCSNDLDSILQKLENSSPDSCSSTEEKPERVSFLSFGYWVIVYLVGISFSLISFLLNTLLALLITYVTIERKHLLVFVEKTLRERKWLRSIAALDKVVELLSSVRDQDLSNSTPRIPVEKGEAKTAKVPVESGQTMMLQRDSSYPSSDSLCSSSCSHSSKTKKKQRAKILWRKLRLGVRSGLLTVPKSLQLERLDSSSSLGLISSTKEKKCHICGKKRVFRHLCGKCKHITCNKHTAIRSHSRFYDCDVFSKCVCVNCAQLPSNS